MGNNISKDAKRKDEITCVQLTKDAKKRLDEFATERRETYESIITRLMDSQCSQPTQEMEEKS